MSADAEMKKCFCGKTTEKDAKKEGFWCCKAAGFHVAQLPDGTVLVGHEMDTITAVQVDDGPIMLGHVVGDGVADTLKPSFHRLTKRVQ